MIDELVELVPPPAVPVDGDGDWAVVERALNVGLPTDFKVLVCRYGLGRFCDVTLLTPFATRADGLFSLGEMPARQGRSPEGRPPEPESVPAQGQSAFARRLSEEYPDQRMGWPG